MDLATGWEGINWKKKKKEDNISKLVDALEWLIKQENLG